MHSIDDMARAGCSSPRGVRNWEDLGLLGEVARSSGDHRRYSDAQLRTAKIIAAAQFGGFSLERISEMLPEYDATPEAHEALRIRLSDQVRAGIRLIEELPPPMCEKPSVQEYDL